MKASERAYRGLLQEILDGVLSPGTILAEVEQASRLGISRTPLREALYKLHADSFITTPTGRGAIVTEISLDRAKELYAVRRALEETAAASAAKNRDDGVFEQIASEFGVAAQTLSLDDAVVHEYYGLNARFDAAIDSAVNNEYLVSALETVRKHATRFRRVARSDLSRLVASAWETQLICEAIAAKNPVLAAHATHVHLHKSLRHVLKTFE
jgi:DNA-binding GntR family transcriptional regulator